jgi:hypothetical protein
MTSVVGYSVGEVTGSRKGPKLVWRVFRYVGLSHRAAMGSVDLCVHGGTRHRKKQRWERGYLLVEQMGKDYDFRVTRLIACRMQASSNWDSGSVYSK